MWLAGEKLARWGDGKVLDIPLKTFFCEPIFVNRFLLFPGCEEKKYNFNKIELGLVK